MSERERFRASTGYTPEDWEREFGWKVFLQGEDCYFDPDTPTIYAHSRVPGGLILERDIADHRVGIILDPLGSSELDVSDRIEYADIVFEQEGCPVVGIFYPNKIVTCDFYHYGNKKPMLTRFLKALCSNGTLDARAVAKAYLEVNIKRSFEDLGFRSVNATINVNIVDIDTMAREINKRVSEAISDVQAVLEEVYNSAIATVNKKLEAVIADLHKFANKLLFGDIGKAFADAIRQGWKLDDGVLRYDGEVVATHMKYKGRIFEIPDDFYVFAKDLKVTLNGSAQAREANHPNISGAGVVCLGNLKRENPVVIASKLIRTLKTVNLDSAYPCDTAFRLRRYCKQNLEEGREVRSDVWTAE